jgi:hypothetical protein
VDVIGNVMYCDQYAAAVGGDAPGVGAWTGAAEIANLRVEGNTFYNCWCLITNSAATSSSYWLNSLILRNNIFGGGAARHGVSIDVGSSVTTEDYNLYYQTTLSGITAGVHSIINRDPQFVDRGTFNLHLLATSPAIDQGIAVSGLTTDMDGVVRPRATTWDIGAYEYPN